MKRNKHLPYLILSNKNLGFIPLIVILYVVLATTAVSGIGYGAYKYNETLQENKAIKVQLNDEKDKEISKLQKEIDQLKNVEVSESTQEEIEEETKNTDTPIAIKQEVVIAPETTNRPAYIPVSERANQNSTVEVNETDFPQQINAPVIKNVSNVRLLTQDDRNLFTSEAQKVIKFDNEIFKLLEDSMQDVRKSSYREEYLSYEQAILETKKLYESDKKMAEAIILASSKAESEDYTALKSAYDIFISSANETRNATEFMFASLRNLKRLSNEVVEARIKLEVIDELSAEYGVSSYGNSDSLAIASANTREATKKADDYVKSLMDKHNDMEKVNNYLIGIIIIY